MKPRRRKAKMNIPMCMACVLFCLTLFSIHVTSSLYARYTVSSLGEDSARVITFGQITLTESGDFEADGKMMIIPGVNLEKKAVVDFTGSEAATYVFLNIHLASTGAEWTQSGNNFYLKNGTKELMRWGVDVGDGGIDDWKFLTAGNGTYIYYLELAPNTVLKDKNIIAGDGTLDGVLYVSDQIIKSEISKMADISITFQATAVQSGGFADATAAWQSIAAK